MPSGLAENHIAFIWYPAGDTVHGSSSFSARSASTGVRHDEHALLAPAAGPRSPGRWMRRSARPGRNGSAAGRSHLSPRGSAHGRVSQRGGDDGRQPTSGKVQTGFRWCRHSAEHGPPAALPREGHGVFRRSGPRRRHHQLRGRRRRPPERDLWRARHRRDQLGSAVRRDSARRPG